MSKGAFSRFYGLMAAMATMIQSAIESGGSMSKSEALIALGGYESRGHGRSKHSGKPVNRNHQTNWLRKATHGGGAREVARRQRQLAAGTLHTN